LTLWTLAVLATTAAFVLFLAMRVRSIELGYELGRAHARLARLREVRRVLELEVSSYKTPERIDRVSRTLFRMEEPPPERILNGGKAPKVDVEEEPMGDGMAAPGNPQEPSAP
jgi:hypothetical protein